MTIRQRVSILIAVALAVVGLGLVASSVAAQVLTDAEFSSVEIAPGPDLTRVPDENVLDKAEYQAASDFTMRVTPYIHLDDTGVPRLDAGVTAEMMGVDQEFMDNFVAALDFAGQAILDGSIVVNDDLTVDVAGASSVSGPVFGPSATIPGGEDTIDSAVGDASLDWQSWRYNSGAMFYNSYQDYYSYYYSRYYVLCSSMAAQLGYPWMSTNLVYFYSYNGWYFNQHCSNPYGMYWFMPYSSSGCYQYNPCYCCGVSYRPIYVWVVTYRYYPSCGCQQPTWGWQGYWARY